MDGVGIKTVFSEEASGKSMATQVLFSAHLNEVSYMLLSITCMGTCWGIPWVNTCRIL